MNQYTLDFSDPAQPRRSRHQNAMPRQRMYHALRGTALLLSGLLCGIALVGLLRQRTETQTLRERYQAQTVQYDSLLAAKVEADRQLEQLRIRLLNYHQP